MRKYDSVWEQAGTTPNSYAFKYKIPETGHSTSEPTRRVRLHKSVYLIGSWKKNIWENDALCLGGPQTI